MKDLKEFKEIDGEKFVSVKQAKKEIWIIMSITSVVAFLFGIAVKSYYTK